MEAQERVIQEYITLAGGDKRSQPRDIREAKHHWQEFQDHHAH